MNQLSFIANKKVVYATVFLFLWWIASGFLVSAFAAPATGSLPTATPPGSNRNATSATLTTTAVPAVQKEADKPLKNNAIPVFIELEGDDSIGSKLSFQLKEVVNSSSQFMIKTDEGPKFKIIITTAPQFSSRPSVGSAYSVVWLYYEKPATFSSFLTHEAGTVSLDEIDGLVARLIEKTSSLAVKYTYLIK